MSDNDSVVTVDELQDDIDDSSYNRQSFREDVSLPKYRHEDVRENNYTIPPKSGSELASKVLMIESKKFYIDIKESRRGRFMKISEVSLGGQKNRMTMEMKSAIEFHDKLTEFIEHYANLGPRARGGPPKKLMSETIFASERRYYLDLKENSRGRFLKLSMTMPPPSRERADILVPAQGMVDLRDALTDLLNEYGQIKSSGEQSKLKDDAKTAPTSAVDKQDELKEESGLALRSEGKTFYFVIDTKHGVQLKISEVRPNFRTAVNIPSQVWDKFREMLHNTTGVKLEGDEHMEGFNEAENFIDEDHSAAYTEDGINA